MQKIVIKVGTSTLTDNAAHLSQRNMLEIARQIAKVHDQGKQVILVTSGSVAAGREVLKQDKMERSLPGKQMLSAIGQVKLMQMWSEIFGLFGLTVGQILLTRADFANRHGYLNVRNTLLALLQHRVLPIINENDSVATRELFFGDNDNLSALVANLIAADLLLLLTDQEGLYTADPNADPTAELIPEVKTIDTSIFELAGKTKKAFGLGAGGMFTKVEAAQLATQSGTPTVIASSFRPTVIMDIVEGKKIGTLFRAQTTPRESRKRWLLSEHTQGKISIDAGAVKKLKKEGASLLPVGIAGTSPDTDFDRGSVVEIGAVDGERVAVGITNYSRDDIEKIRGKHSNEILEILGYSYGPEVIHRDNMTIFSSKG